MVRAIPCQPSTATVQQVQPVKQVAPAATQPQTQFGPTPQQQVPLRQMCLPPNGPKPEKPPRRREPRRHTLAHG